jgi:glyceraldehyde-3-phosphate dehydrogenase (NADP+)
MTGNVASPKAARLRDAFPTVGTVPLEFVVDAHGYERNYLLDGKVQQWNGAVTAVSSPICMRFGDNLTRTVIGKMPLMDEAMVMAQRIGKGT